MPRNTEYINSKDIKCWKSISRQVSQENQSTPWGLQTFVSTERLIASLSIDVVCIDEFLSYSSFCFYFTVQESAAFFDIFENVKRMPSTYQA